MIDKLIEQIKNKNSHVCVGLDPQLKFIPEEIKDEVFAEYGPTLEAVAECFYRFNKGIIDAIYDIVPSVKPQIAMYEEYGIPGVIAYKKTVDYAKSKGLIIIGDIKRGDIGSTSTSYARGHIGSVEVEYNGEKKVYNPFDEDFATVNPYLGVDGIKPFTDVCKENDRGIFILVKTSNPSSGDFQDRMIGEHTLYEEVAKKVSEWGADSIGKFGYSDVGAVVGATYPEIGKQLRELMPHTYFLVPGYGAQGGTGSDLKAYFNNDGLGTIVNSSRGIIAAHTKEKYADCGNYAEAARCAAQDMNKDINDNALN